MGLPEYEPYVRGLQDADGQQQVDLFASRGLLSRDDSSAVPSREQVLRELLDEAHARIRMLGAALEALRDRL